MWRRARESTNPTRHFVGAAQGSRVRVDVHLQGHCAQDEDCCRDDVEGSAGEEAAQHGVTLGAYAAEGQLPEQETSLNSRIQAKGGRASLKWPSSERRPGGDHPGVVETG